MSAPLPRLYDALIAQHLTKYRQMAFISGPRQVGKTTTSRHLSGSYLNWDNTAHQKLIAAGPDAVAAHVGLDRLSDTLPVMAIDEIHKFGRWKNWLKGFFDTYADRSRVIVTGSSRLDVYRRGGDSLMGRYFLYRMHPFSVGELVAHFARPPLFVYVVSRFSQEEHCCGPYPSPPGPPNPNLAGVIDVHTAASPYGPWAPLLINLR
jgi:predicted AAA+ superfamily ATPase